jgi:hypothetical protein
MMAGIAESAVAELISKGVERIANRKKLTSEDLTVLLLHEQGRNIARLESGTRSIAEELRELRKETLPLLTQSKDIERAVREFIVKLPESEVDLLREHVE